MQPLLSSLEHLVFDNIAMKSLPTDPETQNYVRSVAGRLLSLLFGMKYHVTYSVMKQWPNSCF